MIPNLMKIWISVLLAFVGVSSLALENPWIYPRTMTNLPTRMVPNASSNVTSSHYIRPNKPTGILIQGTGTNAVSNGIGVVFRGSADGVVSNSWALFTLVAPTTGTNRLNFFTNVFLYNLPFIHVSQITNGPTGVADLTVTILTER